MNDVMADPTSPWRLLTTLVGVLAGAAVFISFNWLIFVYGVNSGHVVETSLGYFINPLVSVVLGVVVFKERLRPWQWAAVGLAAVAVTVLTVDYGRPPWIALSLAFTFALYGVMKKLVRVEAAPGLFLETAIVALHRFIQYEYRRGDEQAAFPVALQVHQRIDRKRL